MDNEAKLRWKDRKEYADRLIEWIRNNPPDSIDLKLLHAYINGMITAVDVIGYCGGEESDAAKHYIKNIIECKNVIEKRV
jgi:hypothetical protein